MGDFASSETPGNLDWEDANGAPAETSPACTAPQHGSPAARRRQLSSAARASAGSSERFSYWEEKGAAAFTPPPGEMPVGSSQCQSSAHGQGTGAARAASPRSGGTGVPVCASVAFLGQQTGFFLQAQGPTVPNNLLNRNTGH